MMFPKKKRIVNKKLCESYRGRPCWAGDNNCFGQTVGHHLVTKGAGGDDTQENLIPLCVYHHRQIHNGVLDFLKQYPLIMEWVKHNNPAFLDRIKEKSK